MGIDRRSDSSGEEPFYDLDQLDLLIAHMTVVGGIQAVRLTQQRAGADQQITETSAGGDTGMPMITGVTGRQEPGLFMLAVAEYVRARHKQRRKHDGTGCRIGGEFRSRVPAWPG